LIIVSPTAHTFGENQLAPISNESAPYNAGFSQGYVNASGGNIPLKGHHTYDFVVGYINGTASYWFNRGDTEGYNAISPKMPDNYTDYQNYIDGYKQGMTTCADTGCPPHTLEPLPKHTDDNHKNYYIGQHDGSVAADNDDNTNGNHSACPNPSSHTKEYCDGYTAGYSDEGYLLHDA